MRIQKAPPFPEALSFNYVGLARDLLGVDADAPLAAMLRFKTKDAVDLCEQSVVLTDADVVAGMEMGAALPDKDVAGEYELTIGTLGPETLGFAVTAVAGTADALFMCKKLQIDPEHIKPPSSQF